MIRSAIAETHVDILSEQLLISRCLDFIIAAVEKAKNTVELLWRQNLWGGWQDDLLAGIV